MPHDDFSLVTEMRDYCHWQVPVLGTKQSRAEEAPCSLLKSAGQGAFLPPEVSKHSQAQDTLGREKGGRGWGLESWGWKEQVAVWGK